MLAGAGGSVDIGAVLGQAVGGGVAGAIVTVVVGLVKNMMAGQAASERPLRPAARVSPDVRSPEAERFKQHG